MHNRHKRVCTVYRRGLSKPVVDMQRRTETRTLKKRPQRKTRLGSIFGKWPTRKGLNLTFFARSPSQHATPAALLTVPWLSKSFPLTNPCIQLCRDANKRPSMDFRHSSPETDPLASGPRQVTGQPLTTDAKSQPIECTEDDYRSFYPFPALCR